MDSTFINRIDQKSNLFLSWTSCPVIGDPYSCNRHLSKAPRLTDGLPRIS